MKKTMFAVAIIFFVFATTKTMAQSNDKSTYDPKWSVVFGLNQPILLQGFNFEVNYFTKKLVFDYSHGFNLIANGSFVEKEDLVAECDVELTWTAALKKRWNSFWGH